MRKCCLFIVAFCMLCGNAFGQECGTENPDLDSPFHQWFNANALQQSRHKVQALRIVPVVVHVIYRRDNSDHNISDAQIQSQIDILNDDFRGVGGGFDTQVQFCLAGVRRIQSRDHYEVRQGSNDVQAKALSQAPPEQFLNIWVVDELYSPGGASILGFSSFPEMLTSSPATDGVMIADHFFGNTGTAASTTNYNLGRTATHEVGHWLSLLHTHSPPGCDGPSDCFITGDCCCDTPPQMQASYACPVGLNSCNTDQPDLPDPIENYMSYTYDACMDSFTTCQSLRMNLCLDSVRQAAWNFAGGDCPVFKVENPIQAIAEPGVKVYPHPIRDNSLIEISLAEDEVVSMVIFDLQGRILYSLRDANWMQKGVHVESFPANLPSGLYFLRVQIGEEMRVKVVMVD